MDETPMFSTEFIFALVIVVAVILFAVRYTLNRRMQNLEDTVYELTEENESLKKIIKTQEKEEKAEQAEPVAVIAAKPVTNHLVPVGQRNLAVVEAPAAQAQPQETSSIPGEVIAVIMAAVAAMGYSPAAIRAIRPKQRRMRCNRNWVMAGRMANMK